MAVLSVRLDKESTRRIKDLARSEQRDQSAIARELIARGWDSVMVQRYREGKLSLGGLAERLGRPLGETLDVLADLGVPAPLEYDDYLEGFEHLRSIPRPSKAKRP